MCDSYMKGRLAYYTTTFTDLEESALKHEDPEEFKEGWFDASDDNMQLMMDDLEWSNLQDED